MSGPGEFEGTDLAEAIRAAAASMQRPPEAIHYEVLDEGRRGFLGVGEKKVRIRVLDPSPAPSSEAKPWTSSETSSLDEIESLRQFLSGFVAGSPFKIEFQVREEDESIHIELTGPDRDLFLERRGEGLAALQVLVGRVAARAGSAKTILLDSENFRRNLEEEIAEIAILAAERVKKLGEPHTMRPMDPYERRLVHLALKDDPAVETRSEGEGFVKRVTIHPRQTQS